MMKSRFDGAPEGKQTWTRVGNAGAGVLRIALLFGSAAIALALVLTPVLDRRTRNMAVNGIGVDRLATGSIPRDTGHVFTVRRSILHPRPDAVCIIREDGSKSGAC